MRLYRYVGPPEIREAATGSPPGRPMLTVADLPADQEPHTFVVGLDGALRVADRGSEHIACAGGDLVLAAGEIQFAGSAAVMVSNQSTGFCPEAASWPAVARALDRAGVKHPGAFTHVLVFRRCPGCGERNVVHDNDYTCALCETPLPHEWNFA